MVRALKTGAMSKQPVETNEWRRSPRRVRVHFGGVRVADSARTMLLRQHGFLPVYYFPAEDVRTELLVPTDYTTRSPYKGTASYWHLQTPERTARFAVWSYLQPKPGSPDTRGYYGFDWHSMDAWYEEDERVYVHARDPLLRVDALRSSRQVRVEIEGTRVAESSRPVLLFETGLVTRYYLPPEDVRQELLRPSPRPTPSAPTRAAPATTTWSLAPSVIRGRRVAVRAPSARDRWRSPGISHTGTSARTPRSSSTANRSKGLGLRESGEGGEVLPPSREYWTEPPPAAMKGRDPAERQIPGRAPQPPGGRAAG